MTAEWKKYIFAEEVSSMARDKCDHGFILRYKDGSESGVIQYAEKSLRRNATHYLICEPQEKGVHDEMRTRWELTGQPVEYESSCPGIWYITPLPQWIDTTVYRFAEPKPQKVMKREWFLISDGGMVINRGWIDPGICMMVGADSYIVHGDTQEFDE